MRLVPLLLIGLLASGCANDLVSAPVQPTSVASRPTAPATPTRTPTPIPQATAQPPGGVLGGASEIGDQPGYASARVLAISPSGPNAAVGWVSWGANRLDDSRDGRVWVRVQTPKGVWNPLQSVNLRPVKKFFGGLGLAIARGFVTVTVVPWPRRLSSANSPPCNCVSDFTSASPNPEPPCARAGPAGGAAAIQ